VGVDQTFASWINLGFEQGFAQPVHRFWKSPEFGDQGIVFPFIPPTAFPLGWEQVTSQPVHRIFKSPTTGEPGIQSPLIVFFPLGWEQTTTQPKHPIFKSPTLGDPLGIDSAFLNFFPLGWAQILSQDLHRFRKNPDIGDQGIQAVFVPPSAFPLGWEQVAATLRRQLPYGHAIEGLIQFAAFQLSPFGFEQAGQVLFRNNPTRGFGSKHSSGFATFTSAVAVTAFEATLPLLYHRLFRSPDIGDQGIEFPLIRFFPSGWQQTSSQDKHPVWKSPTLGDPTGIDFPYIQFFPQGWAQVASQDRHRFWKSPEFGDQGIQAVFVPPTAFPLGWEQIFAQPIHRIFKSPTTGDPGNQFPQITFFPMGWEVQPPPPPHPRREKAGSIMPIEGGIEQTLLSWFNLGWEQVFAQPVHKFFHSPDIGDAGIVFPFIPPTQFPLGWEQTFAQPPRPKRIAGAVRGRSEFLFQLGGWLNWGFEQTYTQPPRARWERRGLWMRGDEGNLFPLILFRPYGWEVQPWQPPRNRWERRGLYMRGDEGIYFPTIQFFNFGWPVQPWQPPRWPRQWRGAIAPIEPGIQFPFIPPPLVPWPTYEQVQALTRQTWAHHAAALFPWGDQGIYFPFVPPFVPPIPVPRRIPGGLFTIDTVQGYILGDLPIKNQPWTMIFYVGAGLTTGPALLTFTKPDGTMVTNDQRFTFIGAPTITQIRINDEKGGQYIVYTFGQDELDQAGVWTVSAITANYFSNTYSFTVLPIPREQARFRVQ